MLNWNVRENIAPENVVGELITASSKSFNNKFHSISERVVGTEHLWIELDCLSVMWQFLSPVISLLI